jgi:hypothetical protein
VVAVLELVAAINAKAKTQRGLLDLPHARERYHRAATAFHLDLPIVTRVAPHPSNNNPLATIQLPATCTATLAHSGRSLITKAIQGPQLQKFLPPMLHTRRLARTTRAPRTIQPTVH